MSEIPYVNNPMDVVNSYLSRPDFKNGFKNVRADDIHRAGSVIKRGLKRGDSFDACMDLAMDCDLHFSSTVTASDILAVMFRDRHSALPANWVSKPEIMRTILSMTAEIDLGLLRAQKLHWLHNGGISGIDGQIGTVENFLSDLQKKRS